MPKIGIVGMAALAAAVAWFGAAPAAYADHDGWERVRHTRTVYYVPTHLRVEAQPVAPCPRPYYRVEYETDNGTYMRHTRTVYRRYAPTVQVRQADYDDDSKVRIVGHVKHRHVYHID